MLKASDLDPNSEANRLIKWSAKSQMIFFLVVTFAITGIFHYQFIFNGGIEGNKHLTVYLMWTPGAVGLICSLLFGHRLRDIGFGKVSLRHLGLAYAVPTLAAILVFTLLVVSGIDSVGIRSKFLEKYGTSQQVLFTMLLLAPTIGAFQGALRGLGEEIGWRGFLHARMIEAKIPHPYILTGLIWGAWHLPLILFADYATSDQPYLSALLFMIDITSIAVFMGWQRQVTRAVWPAAITHGAHNIWIQGIYPAFIKKGPLDQYFGGESGVFLALIYLGIAIYMYRSGRLSSAGR